MKVLVGNCCHFDSDRMLFYMYIGRDNPNMDLLLTVWGYTEKDCRKFAEKMGKILQKKSE